jgi:hypothetical protein
MTHDAMREFGVLSIEIGKVRAAQAGNLRLEDNLARLPRLWTGAFQNRFGSVHELNAMPRREISGKQSSFSSARSTTPTGELDDSNRRVRGIAESDNAMQPIVAVL